LIPERDSLPRLLALVYLSLAALVAFAFLLWGRIIERIAFCPLIRYFDVPCPTCGGTYAALALVRLDLATAFATNPLVTAAAVALGTWGGYSLLATLVPRWRREVFLSAGEKTALRWLLVVLVLGGWAYQLVK